MEPQPSAPAWTRVASTAFTASRGGFAPSTLALLNYNGLSSKATPISVAVKAAGGRKEPSQATVRNVCGGQANKVLVSYNAAANGAAMWKDKTRSTDYGPTKALPYTGPVLVMKDGVRILTHLDNPRAMTTPEGKKLAVYYGPEHGHCHCHGGSAPPAQTPMHAPRPMPQPMSHSQPMPGMMMRCMPHPSTPYSMPYPAHHNVATPMRVQHHIHHHYEASESSAPVRSIFDERRPDRQVTTGWRME